MADTGESSRARLRWLCRRGTRELDMLLGAFLETDYPAASAPTQRAFARLLEWPDPELYDCLTGRRDAEDPEIADVIARIRQRAGR